MIEVIFAPKATDVLVAQAVYIFEKTQNIDIADKYLDDMQDYITTILSSFPKAGRPAEEYGEGVRKLVYQRYSILYKTTNEQISVLTLFRENLPDV